VRCVWAVAGWSTYLGTGTLSTMCSESLVVGSGECAFLFPEREGVGFSGHSGTTRAEVGFGDEDAFVVARGVVRVVGAR
jgi:hypothetical protein